MPHLRPLLCLALLASLAAPLRAGQFVNGGFGDGTISGNDGSWTDNYDSITNNIQYVSPGQGGGGLNTYAIHLFGNNADIDSYIYQNVAIASISGAYVPMLDYYYVAQFADGSVASDSQSVYIQNGSGGPLATALQISQNNAFGWVHAQYPLTAWAGTTIRVKFDAFASGTGGHQADFYVDNVSIVNATYTPTVTPTYTITKTYTRSPSPTASPTRSPTFTPTPTATPPSQVVNGDFSAGKSGWTEVGSDTGLYGGGPPGYGSFVQCYSFAAVPVAGLYQTIRVLPSGPPTLVFWFQPTYFYDQNGAGYGTAVTGDSEFFVIRDPSTHAVLATPLSTAEGLGGWRQVSYDLSAFEGQYIELFLGTCNTSNSSGGTDQSQANFTGVSVVYPTPTSTPTFTASPTGSPTSTFTHTPTASPTPTATPTPTASPTFTASPTASPSPTPSASPAYPVGPQGRTGVAPVPADAGQPLCLFFNRPPSASHWRVFNLAGERVAKLDFGSQPEQCWNHQGMAPGIYFLVLELDSAIGPPERFTQKVVLLR